jgi:CBS domain containing-hemolysin-like protein
MSTEKPFESKPGILQKLKRRFIRNKDLRESLEVVIETHAQDSGQPAMAEDARSMLGNLLGFSDLRVDDLMVPRADIECIDETSTIADLLALFTTANHSRLPVFRETLDDVTGFIHVKDLMRWIATHGKSRKGRTGAASGISIPTTALAQSIKQHQSLVRDVLHVPPSMPAPDLLVKMKTSRVHMAIVVDEYGGTDGLVSFEDLVEAIVGDIADEHDADDEAKLIKKQGDNTYMADARVAISTLDQMFGVDLLPEDQEDEADTLAGLLFEMGGRIPSRGEMIKHASGLAFEIVQTDPRRVKRVRIHVTKPEPSSDELHNDQGA